MKHVPAHAPRSLHPAVHRAEPPIGGVVFLVGIGPVAQPHARARRHRLDRLAHPPVQVNRGRGHLVYPRTPSLDGVQLIQHLSQRLPALATYFPRLHETKVSLRDCPRHRRRVALQHGSLLGVTRGVQRPSRRIRLRLTLHELRTQVVQLDRVFALEAHQILLRSGQRGRGVHTGGVVRIVRRTRAGDEPQSWR